MGELEPGSGMETGYADVGFGRGFGGNSKRNGNENVVTGAEVSYYSLLVMIQSGFVPSNLLLLLRDVFEYSNNINASWLNLNIVHGAEPQWIN